MSHSRSIRVLLAFMLLIAPGIYILAESGTTKDYYWLLLLGNPVPEMSKAPYLIYEGENSKMMVLWQLHNTTRCKIEWGTDTSYATGTGTTSQYGSDHQHRYRIAGLTPGTVYLYRVSCGSQEIGSGSFRAAPSGNADSVKLMVYGDSRAEGYNKDGSPFYANASHDEVLAEMISAYESDRGYQSIALQTGDWVDLGATEKSWDDEMFSDETPNIREFLANVPIAGTMGNHDLLTKECDALEQSYPLHCYSAEIFDKYFPYPYGDKDHYWSFDYGPVHIAMVNVNVDRETAGPDGVCYRHYVPFYEGSAQYKWLDSDLASTTKPWKIVIFHEQGYSAGYRGYTPSTHQCLEPPGGPDSNNNNKDVQRIIQPLLEKHGVDLVFTGNNHYYARAVKSGVTHVTAAGGGAPLYNRDPADPDDPLYFPDLCYVHKHVKANHFIMLDIQGDTLKYQVINVEEASESSEEYTPIGFELGDVIESLVLTKGAGGPYEAEAADWNPPSRLLDPEDSDHSGWGYIGYLGDGQIEWTIDVQADDSDINLFFGYALGQNETREMFSYLDNERRDRIAFTYTGGWTEWDEMQRNSTITGVSKGCHKIRLKAVENSSPNIDYLRVELAD